MEVIPLVGLQIVFFANQESTRINLEVTLVLIVVLGHINQNMEKQVVKVVFKEPIKTILDNRVVSTALLVPIKIYSDNQLVLTAVLELIKIMKGNHLVSIAEQACINLIQDNQLVLTAVSEHIHHFHMYLGLHIRIILVQLLAKFVVREPTKIMKDKPVVLVVGKEHTNQNQDNPLV